jgi:hypothetical protein
MQRLQQACALFFGDNVASHQIPIPNSRLPPLAPPSKSSYQEGMKKMRMNCLSILAHMFPINLNISCYCAIKIIEMIK